MAPRDRLVLVVVPELQVNREQLVRPVARARLALWDKSAHLVPPEHKVMLESRVPQDLRGQLEQLVLPVQQDRQESQVPQEGQVRKEKQV